VRVLGGAGATRTVAMGAWRDAFPIAWVAEQTNTASPPHIAFHHLRGWTRGMEVAWRFEPLAGGATRVTITHRLAFRFPFAAAWLGRVVVSNYFIHGVAARTLARIKAIAEAAPR
jgi:hypothetical protein